MLRLRLSRVFKDFVNLVLNSFINLRLFTFVLCLKRCIAFLARQVLELRWKLISISNIICHESQTLLVSLTLGFESIKIFLEILKHICLFQVLLVESQKLLIDLVNILS